MKLTFEERDALVTLRMQKAKAATHSGAIGLLGIHFVAKGLISKEHGKFYGKLFELRQTGDYDDWMTVEAEDVISRIEPAQKFIEEIEKLLTP